MVEMNSEVDGVNNDEKRSRKYRIEYLLALKGINTSTFITIGQNRFLTKLRCYCVIIKLMSLLFHTLTKVVLINFGMYVE